MIGIDCEKAGLLNSETSSIPANFGDVIYSANKPSHAVNMEISDNFWLIIPHCLTLSLTLTICYHVRSYISH
ncbi:hypothetical protein HND97_16195 [Vibrio cholerae]|nr:hypothetical protein HND97_16195 [Vibrio cholerae]